MTASWYQSTKKPTPRTKPNHLLVVTFWRRKLTPGSVSVSFPYAKVWRSQCGVYFSWLFNGTPPHYLIPAKRHQWISTRHTIKTNLPWKVWVSLFRLTFQTESKQKRKSNFQHIKGVELWLAPYYSPCSHVWEVTDFAQRYPHHYVEVSLLLFFHHNLLLSDQEEPLLIPYHNLISQWNSWKFWWQSSSLSLIQKLQDGILGGSWHYRELRTWLLPWCHPFVWFCSINTTVLRVAAPALIHTWCKQKCVSSGENKLRKGKPGHKSE